MYIFIYAYTWIFINIHRYICLFAFLKYDLFLEFNFSPAVLLGKRALFCNPTLRRYFESCPLHVDVSCHTCEKVRSHTNKSHITVLNCGKRANNLTDIKYQSRTLLAVFSRRKKSHITDLQSSASQVFVKEYVTQGNESHTGLSHVTHLIELCHTYRGVVSHMW